MEGGALAVLGRRDYVDPGEGLTLIRLEKIIILFDKART
jgi:hypothetical protein